MRVDPVSGMSVRSLGDGYTPSVWVANVLVFFTSICGIALALFLLRWEWKMFGQARQRIRELPPEVRRANIRNSILAVVGMAVSAGLILVAYELGAHAWGTRTGAALAIAVFVVVMGCALTAMVVQSLHESHR
jgi:hypothetical protein